MIKNLIQKVQLTFVSLLVMLGSGLAFVPAMTTHADTLTSDACAGLNTLNGNDGNTTCDSGSGNRINNILRFTINIFSAVVGFVAVLMVIVNGLRFVTANGDSSAIASARNGILYALIGLVIVALSQVFVNFVLHKSATCPYDAKLSSSSAACKAPAEKP